MAEVLHSLPITSHIQYKIILLVSRSPLGLTPKISLGFMRKLLPSTCALPLRSTDHLDIFVPHIRTPFGQCHAFAVTGLSTWNGPSPTPSYIKLCLVFPLHPLLSRFFFHGGSALKAPLNILWEALYKCFNQTSFIFEIHFPKGWSYTWRCLLTVVCLVKFDLILNTNLPQRYYIFLIVIKIIDIMYPV